MSVAPDFAEPLLGWRAWLVVEGAGAFRLRSVVYETRWPPRCELLARCQRAATLSPSQQYPLHAAPCTDCHCGIYAASEPETVASYLDGWRPEGSVVHRVLGRVSLWGTVLKCERGWRASRAYPACLYVPTRRVESARLPVREIALALAGNYGVPVELVACRTAGELIGLVSRAERARAEARGAWSVDPTHEADALTP